MAAMPVGAVCGVAVDMGMGTVCVDMGLVGICGVGFVGAEGVMVRRGINDIACGVGAVVRAAAGGG